MRKGEINLLVLLSLVVLAAIPLTVSLTQQRQDLQKLAQSSETPTPSCDFQSRPTCQEACLGECIGEQNCWDCILPTATPTIRPTSTPTRPTSTPTLRHTSTPSPTRTPTSTPTPRKIFIPTSTPTSRPTPTPAHGCQTANDCQSSGRCQVNCSGWPRKCVWVRCPTPTPTATATPTPAVVPKDECQSAQDCGGFNRCHLVCSGQPRRCSWEECLPLARDQCDLGCGTSCVYSGNGWQCPGQGEKPNVWPVNPSAVDLFLSETIPGAVTEDGAEAGTSGQISAGNLSVLDSATTWQWLLAGRGIASEVVVDNNSGKFWLIVDENGEIKLFDPVSNIFQILERR